MRWGYQGSGLWSCTMPSHGDDASRSGGQGDNTARAPCVNTLVDPRVTVAVPLEMSRRAVHWSDTTGLDTVMAARVRPTGMMQSAAGQPGNPSLPGPAGTQRQGRRQEKTTKATRKVQETGKSQTVDDAAGWTRLALWVGNRWTARICCGVYKHVHACDLASEHTTQSSQSLQWMPSPHQHLKPWA